MKIKEIHKLWVADKIHFVKRSTMSTYFLLCKNHIIPFFGELEEVSEDDVQDFVFKKIKSGMSKKMTSDMLIILKMILKFGDKKGFIKFNQWDVRFPQASKQTPKLVILTQAEHKKLMNYMMDNLTFKNIGILLCLQGGFRIGEICAMQFKDIDLDRKVLVVNKTIQRIYETNEKYDPNNDECSEKRGKTTIIIGSPKTNKSKREVPLAAKTFAILKKMASFCNPEAYILTNELKPNEPRSYRNYYDLLMKDLGLNHMKFHGLRHSFATRCIEAGTDIKTVSEILGHSNVSTTLNLYVHPTLEQKKATIDNIMKKMKA